MSVSVPVLPFGQHAGRNQARSMTASTSAKIVVEPPSRLQKNQVVYPPIVLTIPGHQADPSTHFFATAVLVDSSGNVLDAALSGTTAVTGGFLASGAMAFVFPDLAILKEGSFRIRVDLYGMVYGDDSGATLLAQEYTGKISVKGRPVSPTKPSRSEKAILQEAIDCGLASTFE